MALLQGRLSVEMILQTSFLYTTTLCSVKGKIPNEPYALSRNSLYFSASLSAGKVTNGGSFTHTNNAIENLSIVRDFRTKYVLYQRWFWHNVLDTVDDILASWTIKFTLRAVSVVIVKSSAGSAIEQLFTTEPSGAI